MTQSLHISHFHSPERYFSHSELIHLFSQSLLLFLFPLLSLSSPHTRSPHFPSRLLMVGVTPTFSPPAADQTETSQGNADSRGPRQSCRLSKHRISLLVGFSCRAFTHCLWKVLILCCIINVVNKCS